MSNHDVECKYCGEDTRRFPFSHRGHEFYCDKNPSNNQVKKKMYTSLAEDNDALNKRVGELEAELEAKTRAASRALATMQEAVDKAEAERDRLRGLLSHAHCPNCDGSGAYPHGPDPDGNWELEQCQWCYERRAALEDKG